MHLRCIILLYNKNSYPKTTPFHSPQVSHSTNASRLGDQLEDRPLPRGFGDVTVLDSVISIAGEPSAIVGWDLFCGDGVWRNPVKGGSEVC